MGADTSALETMLRQVDWADLTDGFTRSASHGYKQDGTKIPYRWDTFGGETFLLAVAFTAANPGRILRIEAYPQAPTWDGSGFNDEIATLLFPMIGVDYWMNKWDPYPPDGYRYVAFRKQMDYISAFPRYSELGLFGLSASEVPEPWAIPPNCYPTYGAWGVGGHNEQANDGSWLVGYPIIAPHYAAMVAKEHPAEAEKFFEYLVSRNLFSPLNNVESLGIHTVSPPVRWNELKGSWNLSLQALGAGRSLSRPEDYAPYTALDANAFLDSSYRTLISAYTVTVAKTGNGTVTGTVTSTPTNINCGTACTDAFASGTTVELTAKADSGSCFAVWGGACTGTGTPCSTGACTLTMDAAKSVTATFGLSRTLRVIKTGNGKVTSSPARIDCGANCTAPFASDTTVELTPDADLGSSFAGWSGCTPVVGTDKCTVKMTATKTVYATFKPTYPLTVILAGTGTGTVTSRPPDNGINCGSDCTENYPSGAVVRLIPIAAAGSGFTVWSGCTSISAVDNTCTVIMTAPKTVTATFNRPQYRLTVSKQGPGSGVVNSDLQPGINCGATCTARFISGTVVTLTASRATNNSTFFGWSGAGCADTGDCRVMMDADKTVFATFNLWNGAEQFPLDGAWPVGWTTPAASTAPWQVDGLTAYEGFHSLRSGPIGHGQKSQVQVSGAFKAGAVSFVLTVSSQASYDVLRFYIDGVLKGIWSGARPWTPFSTPVTAGPHTLLWSYEKNGSITTGSDAAWIDRVVLPQ